MFAVALCDGFQEDPSELYRECADADDLDEAGARTLFAELMDMVREAAVLIEDVLDAARIEAAAVAFEATDGLLENPELLKHIQSAIREDGYAGDVKPALLTYVALTSRFLERPLNLAVVSPSASGKNRTVDAALDLMPEEAYVRFSATSPMAIVYHEADYKQKFVVFEEADSIADDGPAASAIRALAEGNQLKYETVEKSPHGGMQARTIIKDGPTGLLTTSTKSLKPQLSTRCLVIEMADSEEQTRAIMGAQALRAMGKASVKADRSSLIAVQRWLAIGGSHEAVVPYAGALESLIPRVPCVCGATSRRSSQRSKPLRSSASVSASSTARDA